MVIDHYIVQFSKQDPNSAEHLLSDAIVVVVLELNNEMNQKTYSLLSIKIILNRINILMSSIF